MKIQNIEPEAKRFYDLEKGTCFWAEEYGLCIKILRGSTFYSVNLRSGDVTNLPDDVVVYIPANAVVHYNL